MMPDRPWIPEPTSEFKIISLLCFFLSADDRDGMLEMVMVNTQRGVSDCFGGNFDGDGDDDGDDGDNDGDGGDDEVRSGDVRLLWAS